MDHILKSTGYDVFDTNIIKGQGCYLYDDRGGRYVDFEAGVWCTSLGHSHPRINEVIKKQVDQIMHLGYRYKNAVVEEAAVKVLEIAHLSGGKCVFLSSGSEAVEFGVQVARRITGKPYLLTLAGSFLSSYGSSGKRSPEEWYLFDWSGCAACACSDECNPECSRLKEMPMESIGGFVLESGNTSGLVKLPPKRLIKMLESMVRRQNGLIMANEITTGIGRTGKWFGYRHYAYQPDIVAMGKSIGNGYPVSAVAMRLEVAEKLESSGFRYAQSHQNDALGCAVAAEVINVIKEEGLIERSSEVGARFKQQLEQLAKRHDWIKEVRGRGLMLAMEFKDEGKPPKLASVHRELFENGFLAGYSPAANLLRFYPALIIKEEDISGMLEKLDSILKC